MQEEKGRYQEEHLAEAINDTIYRHIQEYSLTRFEIIGILEKVKLDWYMSAEDAE